MSLIAGLRALQEQRYSEAIDLLNRVGTDTGSLAEEDFIGAQLGLIAAYEGLGESDRAETLRQELIAMEGIDLDFWSLEMVFSLLEEAEREEEQIVLPPLAALPPEAIAEFDDDVTRPLTQLPPLLARANGTELLSQPPQPARPVTAAAPAPTAPAPTDRERVRDERLLQSGHQALLKKRYAEAIRDLEAFGKEGFDVRSPQDQYALMALIKAYRGSRQIDDAIAACKQLTTCQDPTVQTWVDETLSALYSAQAKQARSALGRDRAVSPREQVYPFPKAGRAPGQSDFVKPKGFPRLLPVVLATVGILFALPAALVTAVAWQLLGSTPIRAIGLGCSMALAASAAIFFFSPWLMDSLLGRRSRLRWSNWPGLDAYSREAANLLQRLSQERKLSQPRLGVIDSPFPFIATYGSLPSSARIVASKGLLSLLDESELATIYAREFSHVVRWDFALATTIAIGSQICYDLYCWGRDWGIAPQDPEDDGAATPPPKGVSTRQLLQAAIRLASLKFFLLHAVANGIGGPFSRLRTYHADWFAARATGNPNGISRSLFKLAYGLLVAEENAGHASPLFGGLAGFSPLSPRSVAMAGGAYRGASEPRQVGRLLLWDIFNPWATWLEWFSAHPLLGRRLQVLGTYAEQLSLAQEFDLATVLRQEAELLDRRKLQQTFYFHWAIYQGPLLLGAIATGTAAIAARMLNLPLGVLVALAAACLGFAGGMLLRATVMFPGAKRMPAIQANSLVADPHLSPLRGRLSRLQGQLVGNASAPCRPDLVLHLQDATGGLELRYTSRLGTLGNLASRHEDLKELVGRDVTVSGWCRRSDRPWLEIDKIELRRGPKKSVKGYPRYWVWVQLGIASLVGLGLIQLRLGLLAAVA